MDFERLQVKLDNNSSFRKKEIGDLSLQINSKTGEIQQVLLRSSFILLYAHFEGFTKESIRLFLQHINSRGIPVKEVKPNLQTLYHAKRIVDVRQSNRNIKFHELITAVLSENTGPFKVDENDGQIVSTGGNLKYNIVEDLLFLLGFKASEFTLNNDDGQSIETKKQFINRNIINVRNKIAHGENLPVTLEQYNEVEEFILGFIDTLKEGIINICSNEAYII